MTPLTPPTPPTAPPGVHYYIHTQENDPDLGFQTVVRDNGDGTSTEIGPASGYEWVLAELNGLADINNQLVDRISRTFAPRKFNPKKPPFLPQGDQNGIPGSSG